MRLLARGVAPADGVIDDLGAFHSVWFVGPDGTEGESTLVVDPELREFHAPRPVAATTRWVPCGEVSARRARGSPTEGPGSAEKMAGRSALSLVAGERAEDDGRRAAGPEPTPLSNGWVLLALARRSLPHVLEATLVPAVISYVLLLTVGAGAAMVAVLAWTYIAVGRRVARGVAIPSILMLATIGLTMRTMIGVASGSTFAYFVQPVATTVVLAAVFAGSVVIGRPVIGRVASDFCHLAPEVAARPGIVRLFEGLTLLWAGVHFLTAATTFGMLVSMSPANYVALKTVTCLAITVAAIVLTVSCSIRTARSENLVLADARV
jgi:hypothetical protein